MKSGQIVPQKTHPIHCLIRFSDSKVDSGREIGREIVCAPVLTVFVLMQGVIVIRGEAVPELSRSLVKG